MQLQDTGIAYKFDKFQNQSGVKVNYPDIIPTSFITLIVGKPGSGKSSLLEDLITNPDIYNKKFNKIFLISPGGLPNSKFIQQENWSQTLDWPWIYERIADINKLIKSQEPQVLFIFDDVIADLKTGERNALLMKFIFNRRHLLVNNGVISIIITTQKYIICPPKIRSILDAIYFFNIIPADWKKIKDEHLYKNYKVLESQLEQVFKTPHTFIYINLQKFNIYVNYKLILQQF